LSPPNDLRVCRDLGALGTVLVPNPAPLASVDQFKIRVVDRVRDLGQGRISCVVVGGYVTTVRA